MNPFKILITIYKKSFGTMFNLLYRPKQGIKDVKDIKQKFVENYDERSEKNREQKLEELKRNLLANEKVEISLSATLDEGRGIGDKVSSTSLGFLALTNNRIIFSASGLLGSAMLSINYDKITNVLNAESLISDTLIVETASRNYKFVIYRMGSKEKQIRSIDLAGIINKQMNLNSSSNNAKIQSSDLDSIERLSKLHESGVLTKEEFEAKKKEILGL